MLFLLCLLSCREASVVPDTAVLLVAPHVPAVRITAAGVQVGALVNPDIGARGQHRRALHGKGGGGGLDIGLFHDSVLMVEGELTVRCVSYRFGCRAVL